MASLDDLTTPLTRDEVETSIYSVLAALGVTTTAWKGGAVVRTMIVGVAIVLAALSTLMARITKSGFLDSAEEDWLEIVADQVYDVEKQQATFAAGVVVIDNTSGSVYGPLAAGDLIAVNPTTGKGYVNTSSITILAASIGLIVDVQAQEAGSDSTSLAGEIDSLETALTGVTITNPTAIIGTDAQSDPSLRTLCRQKLGALSPNGPKDAYSFVAKTAVRLADGSLVGVTRITPDADADGNLTIYVATATGAVTGTILDLTSDLGAVHDALQINATPLAITEITASAVEVIVPVAYQLWLYNDTGLDQVGILAVVAASLADMFKVEPIGGNDAPPDLGRLYPSAIESAITCPDDIEDSVIRVVLALPANPLVLSKSEVPVLGTITGTITQVPRPGLT